MVIVDSSDGPMFVKKVLHLFAISFLSVIILPSNLKKSGVLFVVLCVTSLMTFHVCLMSFVYLANFWWYIVIHYFCLLYIAF